MQFSLRYLIGCLSLLLLAGCEPSPQAPSSRPQQPESRPPAAHAPATAQGRPDFRQLAAGPARKQAFIQWLVPQIQAANDAILQQRQRALTLLDSSKPLSAAEQQWLMQLCLTYLHSSEDPRLCRQPAYRRELFLERVDMVPVSMVLAQAANESGWGTSRFAIEGNNYFGQWCYKKGCGLVPAARDETATHEVRRFTSAADSIHAYLRNLNRHPQYADFRATRRLLRQQQQPLDALILVDHLGSYSQRGQAYIEELKQMIRYNKLQRYDSDWTTTVKQVSTSVN